MIEGLKKDLHLNKLLSRKVLARVPLEKGDWKPHEKSMTLLRLTTHTAELPIYIASILKTESLDFANLDFKPLVPNSIDDVLHHLEEGTSEAMQLLDSSTVEHLNTNWQATYKGQVFVDRPRIEVIRRELGHIAHHRGQLTVYLRLLDIPLPNTYGPTADER